MTPLPPAAPRSLRVVELFGPSSAGKSSLARSLVAGERGGRFVLHEDRILGSVGLGWLRPPLLRTLAIDALAALEVIASHRKERACYRAASAQALRGAGPRSLTQRLFLLRNAWKAVALRRLAARVARKGEIVLMDEGPLQTAHYLFVHADVPPAQAALDAYLAALPLPDAALYVRGSRDELVARTLVRTHVRLAAGSREEATRFVSHALEVFDRAAAEPRVRERLIPLEALVGEPGCEACA